MDHIELFHTILSEYSMAHIIVDDVLLHSEVIGTVDGHCTVVRTMYGATTDVRGVDVADQVEVKGIATQLEGLWKKVKV